MTKSSQAFIKFWKVQSRLKYTCKCVAEIKQRNFHQISILILWFISKLW